ncbi:methyltransferase domain-containing protein [Nitratireductor sp. CAU 1489]|uniref:Methyltransferase domain-containing protein n=1 Tax=Nitratireductor arenosus TaxID=2682096 RepID=A0A844QQQ0_9HYPH|nr:methyltransferase domain-containing protein [Nitratireductor arenosus]
MGTQGVTGDFDRRRQTARARVNRLDGAARATRSDRQGFFEAVYDEAGGDAAGVPWADLTPKPELVDWLADNPGNGRRAIDVACGLGDNAEAIAAAGYRTAAFDTSRTAIEWAKKRFPASRVDYRAADLLDPPPEWRAGFDLVNECYTIRSVAPAMQRDVMGAIAALVAPGGILLVYTRLRPSDSVAEGPPWPPAAGEARGVADFGLELAHEHRFEISRPGRTIPHLFATWRKP